MDIKAAILGKYSKEQALAIAAFACSSKERFQALMDCFISEEYRLSQRAAWSVAWAAKKNQAMVLPYCGVLVNLLKRPLPNSAVTRNALRILIDIPIPETYHGQVMDCCFQFIENPKSATAVKAFALHVLHKLSALYPDILPELKVIIEERLDGETPAFKSSAKKILKTIQQRSTKNA